MDIDKFLKTKTFAVIFVIWLLAVNVLYYMQFKDYFKMVLKKIGF